MLVDIFINKIKNYPNISKNNIAGNLVDATIDNEYKQPYAGDQKESWGHISGSGNMSP